jgi:hypothetical protein
VPVVRIGRGSRGRQLAGKGASWQDKASVGSIRCQSAGYGASRQDGAAVGRIGRQSAEWRQLVI